MKTIYTKVVADLFHIGHVNFFRNARALGDKLVVHVVDDARVTRAKRKPIMSQAERIALVSACKYVDEATADGPVVITREFMVAQGYDIYAFAASGEEDLAAKLVHCPDLSPEMLGVLDRTPGISTSELIRKILDSYADGKF